MTLKLRDLIRSVRECKTAAEERTIIAKECAEIRASFSATDSTTRHRNISKLIVCNPLCVDFLFFTTRGRECVVWVGGKKS